MKGKISVLFGVMFLFFSFNVFAQLSGTYYIGATSGSAPGGGDPDYATLGEVFTALNTSGVSGACTFYFLDASYTEPNNLALACSGTSAINTILFKPYTGVTTIITFTQLADNAGPSGRIVLGSNTTASYTLSTMEYVTFDGSNTVGGTSRDLTITETNNTPTFTYGIRIVGDVNNTVIKNLKVILAETGTGSTYGILVTPRNQSATDYIPDDITIENCEIKATGGNACQGLSIGASGTLLGPNYPSGIKFYNNTITARTRGIFLSTGTGNTEIKGNEINIVQIGGGTLSEGIYAYSVANSTRTINIYNNQFKQLSTANATTGDYGIVGIYIGTQGVYEIYNNMITGFDMTTVVADPKCVVEGIRVSAATVNGITTTIKNNTVVIPDLTITLGAGIVIPKAFVLNMSGASGTKVANLENNILSVKENDFSSYSFFWSNTALATLTSDHNNFAYPSNGKAGSYGGVDCNLLSDWQAASSKDANSVSKEVTFESATDLHLAGASIGDNDLTGVPNAYLTDLDGDTRDLLFPYMGADERTESPLHATTPRTVPMSASYTNEVAFGANGLLGSDGTTKYYTHWDANYLYLGWSGGRTNYSSDLFYAAIDTDPDGTNGTNNAIEGVGFLAGNPNPDFYVVYENNSSFYGAPAATGNAYEIYNVNAGAWSWVSRTDGNDNTNSYVTFTDGPGDIRLRISWATLGVTPAAGTKLGIVMWNNNASGNYMWGRVPITNPVNGAVPKTLENEFVFNSTGDGVNISADGILTMLPVELTSFTASSSNDMVNLSWSTATEINAYLFEVQRSSDNNNWVTVGDVDAAGNSNSVKNYEYTDVSVVSGKYYYRLKQIDNDGAYEFSDVVEVEVGIPTTYSISQNYPNPFNPTTKINYTLPISGKVSISIFSITGELVQTLVNEQLEAGNYTVDFDGSHLASGTYFYRISANDFVQTKKMMLIK
ncbi:MAG: T9SS type A sorting domain-containing protein [bacterium]